MLKKVALLIVVLSGFFLWANIADAGCCVCGTGINTDACVEFVEAQECNDEVSFQCGSSQWIQYFDSLCIDVPQALCSYVADEHCCVGINYDDNSVVCNNVSSNTTQCAQSSSESVPLGNADIANRSWVLYKQYCGTIPSCNSSILKPKVNVVFTPQITIPFSNFIAGKPILLTFNTLGEYIIALYVFFVSVAGILATVMMMYGGYKYIVSLGNPQKTKDAKDQIVSALLGLVITIGSYFILVTISPKLVEFKSLQVNSIQGIPSLEHESISVKGASSVVWSGNNVDTYDALLEKAAMDYGVPRNWMKAIMFVESSGNPSVTSSSGACGLMQLLPSTAQELVKQGEAKDSITCERLKKEPSLNIDFAGRYLSQLMKNTCPTSAKYRSGRTVACYPEKTECRTSVVDPWVIAAYNGGIGANCSSITCEGQTWWECLGNPGFSETRSYVQKVRSAYDKIVKNGW